MKNSRGQIRFAIILAILLSSCVKDVPPPAIEPDPVLWQKALQECRPSATPLQWICPKHTLERVWDILADFEVDVLSCRRDLQHAQDTCTIKVAEAEGRASSFLHQWWFWLPVGVVAGAAITAGAIWGVSQ